MNPLEAAEEVSLVANDWPAKRAAPLLFARVRLVEVLLLDEEILRRQVRVDEIAEGAPAEGVGALSGDGVDDATRRPPILGVELVGDDLELLNRLQGRTRLGAGTPSTQIVIVVPAVDDIEDLLPCWPLMFTDSDAGSAVGLCCTPGNSAT